MRLVRSFLACSTLLATGGCGLLAGPVSDATDALFDVPVIDDAKFSDDRVKDLQSTHALSAASPTTTLPIDADTTIWGPVIRTHLAALASNQPGIFKVVVSELNLQTPEPLVVNVTPSSRDGKVWGMRPGASPRDPATCHFRLSPDATAAELGRRLTMCAEDWVNDNGVPNALELTITAGGELPEGQKGLTPEFTLDWSQELHTDNQLEENCKVVKLDQDVVANGEFLDLEEAQISGWGYSDVAVYLGAFAIVHDGNGKPTALALLSQSIAAGTRYWIIAESQEAPDALSGFTLVGNVQPVLSPGMPHFPVSVVRGLAGTDGQGAGEAIACWSVYGDAPRSGGIGLTVKGQGSLRGLTLENAK